MTAETLRKLIVTTLVVWILAFLAMFVIDLIGAGDEEESGETRAALVVG